MFVTGFGAQKCSLPRVSHPGFRSADASLKDVRAENILFHYVNSRQVFFLKKVFVDALVYQLQIFSVVAERLHLEVKRN